MTSEKRSMSQRDFTKADGDLCPSCKSSDICRAAEVSVYPNVIFRKVTCLTCGATWEEELKIAKYWRLKNKE